MKLDRRNFLKVLSHVLIAYGLGSVGLFEYSLQLEPEWLQIKKVRIALHGLGRSLDGFKIVQLSDFHLSAHTDIRLIQKAVEIANQLHPDLLVLTGDYVLDFAELIFELTPVLAGLDAAHGVYSIVGNHDYWTDPEVVRLGLEQARIPLLINEGIPIHSGRDSFYLAGMDDGWSGQPDLDQALSKWSDEMPAVLLVHEPDFWDDVSSDPRISLQLSGHTHGGQVRLPGYGAPILPRYGQKYDQGLFHNHGRWLYVNRGIGVVPPPVRFNCRPEITEITLTV
jgi:predicted MPP superfamily phosphohydrolase